MTYAKPWSHTSRKNTGMTGRDLLRWRVERGYTGKGGRRELALLLGYTTGRTLAHHEDRPNKPVPEHIVRHLTLLDLLEQALAAK